jgi:hypothetical protein
MKNQFRNLMSYCLTGQDTPELLSVVDIVKKRTWFI